MRLFPSTEPLSSINRERLGTGQLVHCLLSKENCFQPPAVVRAWNPLREDFPISYHRWKDLIRATLPFPWKGERGLWSAFEWHISVSRSQVLPVHRQTSTSTSLLTKARRSMSRGCWEKETTARYVKSLSNTLRSSLPSHGKPLPRKPVLNKAGPKSRYHLGYGTLFVSLLSMTLEIARLVPTLQAFKRRRLVSTLWKSWIV